MVVAFAHEALSIVTLNSGGENMNRLVSKTQQTTSHGDSKISTTNRISFSSKIARNWLAPWRVHLLDELLVLIVTIPRRAG